jgi:hypothetical protein
MKIAHALNGRECCSQNFGTIHIHDELRYLLECIESGGDLSRPATERKPRC